MPFSARQVRASLQRNSAVVAGLKGLGCAECGGSCKGLGDCYYNDSNGQYDICDMSSDSGSANGYGNVNVPMSVPNAASGGSSWLNTVTALTNAAVTRLAVPQLNPGQSITKLANGTQVLTQQAPGYPLGSSQFGADVNVGSSGNGVLLLVGGLALVLMMGKKS